MQVDLAGYGSNHTLVYLMTVDNSGPQEVAEVLEGWRNLRRLFPNATLLDSSLEAFTEVLLALPPSAAACWGTALPPSSRLLGHSSAHAPGARRPRS